MFKTGQEFGRWTNFSLNARSAGVALLCAIALSGCNRLPPQFSELRLRQHFEAHQANFMALEAALHDIDPSVRSVIACPSEQPCYYQIETLSEAESRAEQQFAPLLEDLGFPGTVFFDQQEGNRFEFPNLDSAQRTISDQVYRFRIGLSLWLDGVPSGLQACGGYVPSGLTYECFVPMTETWAIHHQGENETLAQKCADQYPDQWERSNEEDKLAYYSCLGIPPPWEGHESDTP